MAIIQKTTSAEREAISRRSVLQLADRPSEYGQKPSDVKNAIAMPVFGEHNSVLAVLDRVVDDLNTILNGDSTTDQTLQTTAQTLVGAINELRSKLTASDPGEYYSLPTTAQTVLEAIAELDTNKATKAALATAVSDLESLISDIETIVKQYTDGKVQTGVDQANSYTDNAVEAERDLRNQAIAAETARATAAENGKVDKLTNLEAPAVYVGNPDGTQTNKYLENLALANSVPLRDGNGNIHVGDATQVNHAVNLGTVRILIQDQIGRVYKPAGSISFAELINTVDLDESNLGNIYNIKNAFTTTDAFVEGAGVSYPEGTNVGVVKDGNNYYFDVFVGQTDLSGYAYLEAASNSFSGDMEVGGDLQVYGDLLNINGHTYINTDDQATAAEMAEILAVLS